MENRWILTVAAMLGAAAVAIGAFGAHAFKPHLEAIGRADVFETAVKYHFYHSLALLALGFYAQNKIIHYTLKISAVAWILGILIFSGSLYLICITDQGFFGGFAPIGGLAFIVGWLSLIWVKLKA